MLRNIGSNWVLLAVNIGIMYVLTPFIIRTLGNDGYGAWTLVTAISGYFTLFMLGVPAATVRFVAQHLAARDIGKANATIGSCAGFYLIVGGVALALVVAIAPFLDRFEIPAGLEGQAWLAFLVMGVYVAAGFVGMLPEGIMVAHHDFVVRNVVRIAAILLRFGLTLAVLSLHPSLVALALVQVTVLAFDIAVSWRLIRRRYPEIRITLRDFDPRVLRQVFSFSLFVLLLSAGTRLTFETDAVMIGAFIGVGAIPFYVVANSLIVYLMEFVISIAVVVSPMATQLHAQGRMEELRTIFLKWSKVALSFTLVAGLFLIVLGGRFIGWWIDPSYEQPSGEVLTILMLSSFVFLPIRGVAVPLLMGIGKPGVPAVGFLVSGAANIALSIALAGPYGLAGIALGTAIPNVIFALAVAVVACRELELPVWRFTGYVVPRAACGALPVLALLLWFEHGVGVNGALGLAAAGLASLFVFGVIWILFVYHRDPYVDTLPHLARIRAWSRV